MQGRLDLGLLRVHEEARDMYLQLIQAAPVSHTFLIRTKQVKAYLILRIAPITCSNESSRVTNF